MQASVELDRVDNHALVAKGERVLCLKSIENNTGGQIKYFFGCNGKCVVFDEHMSIRRDAAPHGLWSPVASTAEARVVLARAL